MCIKLRVKTTTKKVAELDLKTQFFFSVGEAMQINFQTNSPLLFPAIVACTPGWSALKCIKPARRYFYFYAYVLLPVKLF